VIFARQSGYGAIRSAAARFGGSSYDDKDAARVNQAAFGPHRLLLQRRRRVSRCTFNPRNAWITVSRLLSRRIRRSEI